MDLKNLSKEKVVKYIKDKTADSPDMMYRTISVKNYSVNVLYNEHVCNSEFISNFVIKSINNILNDYIKIKNVEEIKDNIDNNNNNSNIKIIKRNKINKLAKTNENNYDLELLDMFMSQIYFSKAVKFNYDKDDIFHYIYSGFAIIVLDDGIIALETRAFLNRAISEPTNERTLKGPKDAFNENYSMNIGLIRRRIKEPGLRLEESLVGRRTKTKVGILYVDDICNKDLIKKLQSDIDKINIDSILDSNTLSEFFTESSDKTVFPTIISTERPDLVCNYLLQGRAVLIVENSPFAIVLPIFLADFFKQMDDYYEKSNASMFIRLIRYLAFFISLFAPAIYIALTTFNQEALPTDLLISFAVQRDSVPAPAIIEALIMIIGFEVLREGDFRAPSMAGSTLSIVGALILGEAAVNAGIVSPVMIIVVAITVISGIIFTDINFINALRRWRLILLIFAATSGIVGIVVASILLVIKLVSVNSYKVPYMYPFAPLNMEELVTDTLNRKKITKHKRRNSLLTKNLFRMKKENSL